MFQGPVIVATHLQPTPPHPHPSLAPEAYENGTSSLSWQLRLMGVVTLVAVSFPIESAGCEARRPQLIQLMGTAAEQATPDFCV